MKNKLLSLIFKEKIIIFLGLLTGLTAFLVYFNIIYTPMYLSKAALFVRNFQQQNVVTPTTSQTVGLMQSESGYSNPLFNLTNLLESERLSSAIYKTLAEKYPEDLKKMHVKSKSQWNEKYSKLIKTKITPSTDIVNVTFDWPNKNNAADILSLIITQFKQSNIGIRKAVETKQRQYLDGQVAEIATKLNDVRSKIRDYRLTHRAVNLPDESTELTRARVDLEKQAEVVKSDASYYNGKVHDLASQLGFSSAQSAIKASSLGEDPYLVKLNQDLATSEQNYSKLKAKFKDSYPDVVAAKNEISSLKQNIEHRERETFGNSNITRGIYDMPSQGIVSEFSKAQAENRSVRSRLGSINNGIRKLASQESELPTKFLGLEDLQKEEAALLTAYTNVKQAQLEAKIKENQIVDNIITIDAPSKAKYLIATVLTKFLGFLSFGFIGALGIAWLKEDLKDEWTDYREVESITGKKVLGVIPWIKTKEAILNNFIQKPDSLMGTAYRSITTNLISRAYLEESQVLSFISTIPTRSQSSVISNIAATLAKLDKSIVYVDIDFTRPGKLLKNLGSNSVIRKDLIDVINEVNMHFRLTKAIDNEFVANALKDALIPISIDAKGYKDMGFYYLCINKKGNNLFDYVASRGFDIIISFLKKHNEFVLIETPPKPLIFPEISEVIGASDSAVIISAIETSREELTNMVQTLDNSGNKILGIITREENSEFEEHFRDNDIETPEVQKV